MNTPVQQNERSIVNYARNLQEALVTNQLAAYCDQQATETKTANFQLLWAFLSIRSMNCSRKEYLALLRNDAPLATDDEAINDIKKEIETYTACNRELDDDEESVDSCIVTLPLKLDDLPESEETLLNWLCFGDPEQAVAAALAQRQFITALLFAYNSSDENIMRFIALHIQEQFSSSVLRLSALMASGMWNELLTLWNMDDWKRLFCLILARAPSSKIRRLCGDLAKRMIGGESSVNAALPAIVAGDVETMVTATETYPIRERVALAAILRQCIGGGSSRAVVAGIQYQSILVNFTKQLIKEGHPGLAKAFVEVIHANDCTEELRQLQNSLLGMYGPTVEIPSQSPRARRNRKVDSRRNAQPFATGNAIPSERCSPSSELCRSKSGFMSPFPYISCSSTESVLTNNNSLVASPPYPAYFLQQQNFSPLMHSQPQMITEYHNGVVSTHLNHMTPAQLPAQTFYPIAPVVPVGGFLGTFRCSQLPLTSPDSNSACGAMGMLSSRPNDSLLPSPLMGVPFVPGREVSSGWNDPPAVVDMKRIEPQSLIADINWKPCYPEQNSGRLAQNVSSFAAERPNPSNSPMDINVDVDTLLSDADRHLLEVLGRAIHDIQQKTTNSVALRKLEGVQQKIALELIPRLAHVKFSQLTLGYLHEVAERLARGDLRACNLVISRLATGPDFTELSAILPALKTLILSAQQFTP